MTAIYFDLNAKGAFQVRKVVLLAEVEFDLLLFGNRFFEALLFLLAADFTQVITSLMVTMKNCVVEGSLVANRVTPGFSQHPISHQILIEADNEIVLLFAPTYNQEVTTITSYYASFDAIQCGREL
ncbi:MAG: hypothetical protein V7731_08250 [Amphritea sp.]